MENSFKMSENPTISLLPYDVFNPVCEDFITVHGMTKGYLSF